MTGKPEYRIESQKISEVQRGFDNFRITEDAGVDLSTVITTPTPNNYSSKGHTRFHRKTFKNNQWNVILQTLD